MAWLCITAACRALRPWGRERPARRGVGVLAPSSLPSARIRQVRSVISNLLAPGDGAIGCDGLAVCEYSGQFAAGDAAACRSEQYEGHRSVGRPQRHESVGAKPLTRGLAYGGFALVVRGLLPDSNAQDEHCGMGDHKDRPYSFRTVTPASFSNARDVSPSG